MTYEDFEKPDETALIPFQKVDDESQNQYPETRDTAAVLTGLPKQKELGPQKIQT